MTTNPLKDFGQMSCSNIEQHPASAEGTQKYSPEDSSVVDEGTKVRQSNFVGEHVHSGQKREGRSQVISDCQASERSELLSPNMNNSSDNNNSAPIPWWDDKAIEREPQSKGGMLQDRQPTFEIGKQIPDLHGFRGIDPANNRKYEKYEHRIIAELKAGGRTNQEICEITGYCASSVASIVKLPWVKQFVMDEIHKHGGQAVVDYMSQHAMPAAETVVSGFMDEEMPRGRDRVAAANSLLDRLFGKANQNIVSHKGADLAKVSDEELAAIAQSPQN